MAFDMRPFLQTFFEESFEGLDAMESALFHLDVGRADPETINSIFRAAHFIKGGSATFGLSEVSHFTHGVETLLDEMRDGRRQVTQQDVELLLRAVDFLREMLTAAHTEGAFDAARAMALERDIAQALEQHVCTSKIVGGALKTVSAHSPGWRIHFKPFPHLLKSGNEPTRMFRELAALGELQCECDVSALPALVDLDPEEIHLRWTLTLEGNADEKNLRDVFEWVDGDCDLSIVPLGHTNAMVTLPTPREAELTTLGTGTGVATDPRVPVGTNADTQLGDTAPALLTILSAPPAGERRNSGERRQSAGDTGSIRVAIDKIDALINMMGELVITQSMLHELGAKFEMGRLDQLQQGLAQLERNTRELQDNVMRIRMLPISFAFNRFPRMVHDLSQRLGKKVELKLAGEQTELDKTVMERIGDPLIHLVRNAIDHGIESPQERLAAGKREIGTLHLNAYHQGGNIVIEIRDDGAGINKARVRFKAVERGLLASDEQLTDDRLYDLIFAAGFSTAEQVSDVSGRGVGMDVVRRNIKELGGTVEVVSQPNIGSRFTIRLPLTLAILDGQLIRVGKEIYIFPLVSIVESLQVKRECINVIANRTEVYKLRDEYIPIVRLCELFGESPDSVDLNDGLLVLVEGDGNRVALRVDDLLNQQQVVIKSLEANYRRVPGVSGATILGDGRVALILDITGQAEEVIQQRFGNAERYGNVAMEHLINAILANGGRRGNFEVKLFGGGRILSQMTDVGQRNIDFVHDYLRTEGLQIAAEDLGDVFPRKVYYFPLTGTVKLKKLRSLQDTIIAEREHEYLNGIIRKPVAGEVDLF